MFLYCILVVFDIFVLYYAHQATKKDPSDHTVQEERFTKLAH